VCELETDIFSLLSTARQNSERTAGVNATRLSPVDSWVTPPAYLTQRLRRNAVGGLPIQQWAIVHTHTHNHH
jgi:hypothetical protein